MRVLLTRAREDAEPLAARLADLGLDADIEPLLNFVSEADTPIDLDGVQALIFTSATGARMFAARSSERQLPVFAVGDTTAAAARAVGFARVESAGGDVEDLARLIQTRLDAKAGALFHGAARQVAGDLQGQLTASGFDLRREILYRAEAIGALSEAVRSGLAEGRYDAVAFFSPRTAETFVRLVTESDADLTGSGCHAACLSQAVASRIEALPWAGIRIAERPNQEALIGLLAALKLDLEAPRPQVTAHDDTSTDERMAEEQENPKPSEDTSEDRNEAALAVIGAFGGIRPMATKLDIPVSTVQGWRERGVIPASRHPQILEAALEHDIDIDADLVTASADRSDDDDAELETVSDDTPYDTASGDKEAEEATGTIPEAIRPSSQDRRELPQPHEIPSAVSPPPARRGGGILLGFLLAIVILGAGAVGAVITRDQWLPLVQGGGDQETDTVGPALEAFDGKLAALSGELGGLATNLSALERRVEEQPAAPTDQTEQQAALSSAIEGMTERLTALEAGLEAAQQSAGTAPDTAPLEIRLDKLEAKLDGLSAGSGEGADLGPLLDRLAGLEDRLSQLDQVTALNQQQTALSEQVAASAEQLASLAARADTAQARVEELERQAAEATGAPDLEGAASAGDVALMLALNRLKDAVASTGSYESHLATVRELMGGDEGLSDHLTALAQAAGTGAPTREELRRQFPAVARTIVAAGAGGEEESWSSGIMRSLSSLVTLRRTGEVEGDSHDAVVARTEVRVRDGDLEGAMEQLNALSGHAAEAAQDWRSQAELRLAAEQAIALLTESAIARIASKGE